MHEPSSLIFSAKTSRKDDLPVLTDSQMKQRFYEDYVCDLTKEEDLKFQDKMQSIIKRLNPDHDFENEPIEFVLDQRDMDNAYYINLEGKHIIGITKSMIKEESLLHLVIGHEYGHLRSRVKGIEKNSKAEEAFSDLHLLSRLEELGLDATVAERFFTSEKPFSLDTVLLMSIADVHPLNSSRQGLIESALGVISSNFGGLNAEESRLKANSPEHKEFSNFINQSWQKTIDFNEANHAEIQLNRVDEILSQTRSLSKILFNKSLSTEKHKETISQICIHIDRIKRKDVQNPELTKKYSEVKDELNSIIEHIASNYDRLYGSDDSKAVNFLYEKSLEMNFHLNSSFDILGLREDVRSFVEAKDPEAIKKHARDIQNKITHSKAFFATRLEHLQQDSFATEDSAIAFRRGEFSPAWEDHIKSNDELVMKTLVNLGVFDNRLIDYFGIIDYARASDQIICTSSRLGDAMIVDYPDENGEIKYRDHIIFNLEFQEIVFYEISVQREDQLKKMTHDLTAEIFEAGFATKKQLEDLKTLSSIDIMHAYSVDSGDLREAVKKTPVIPGLSHAEQNLDLFFELIEKSESLQLLDDAHEDITNKLQELLNSENIDTYKEMLTRLIAKSEGQHQLRFVLSQSILDNPNIWTNLEEKAQFLNKVSIFSLDGEDTQDWHNLSHGLSLEINYDNGWLVQIREAFNQDDVEDLDGLKDRLKIITNLTQGALEDNTFSASWACSEICECLDLLDSTEDVNLVELVMSLPKGALRQNERFRSHVMDLLSDYDFSETKLEDRLNFLEIISSENLIEDPTIEDKIISRGIEQIDDISDINERLINIERFYATSATDWPGLRSKLNSKWVQTVEEISKGDDDLVYDLASKASKKLSQRDFNSLSSLLADKINSQEELSNKLGALANEGIIDTAVNAGQKTVGIIETIKHIANVDVGVRDAITDLLHDNTTKNRRRLEANLTRAVDRQQGYISVQAMMNSDQSGSKKSLKDFLQENQHTKDRLFEVFHNNFWNSPLYARAGILKEIMLPYQADEDMKEQFFWGTARYVIDKLVDSDDPSAKDTRNTLVNFCKVLSHRERPLFISAVLAAAEQTKGLAGEDATGKRLATLFSMMGPAWIKLGQAIHSFDKTPENIREGMEMMKLDVDAPTRWDLFKHIKKTIPHELRNKIVNVGERLGSASYYYVYKVTHDDGKDYALALLKPHAKNRSEHGFKQMSGLISEKKSNGEDSTYLSSLEGLVNQSKQMAKVETDNANVAFQEQVAIENNAETTVKVNGQAFEIDVARNIITGDGFRLMELAQGQTFNEIDKSNDPEFYKNFGLGYHTLELTNILSGNYFDEDRHGGQLKLTEN